ncbi:MAG: Flp family type IVb pilin [Deltaproteobacteria bacterium]|nr:Flp family type IVb pilin [Deltaproteobacteria bacterium]
MKRMQEFWEDCEGASMVEYGLLVTFIALACILAVGALGSSLMSKYNEVAGNLAK